MPHPTTARRPPAPSCSCSRRPRPDAHARAAVAGGGSRIFAIYPRGAEARLPFEHGRHLDDPEGLLEGDGSQTRHVTVRAAQERLAEALGHLVRDAVAERLFRR